MIPFWSFWCCFFKLSWKGWWSHLEWLFSCPCEIDLKTTDFSLTILTKRNLKCVRQCTVLELKLAGHQYVKEGTRMRKEGMKQKKKKVLSNWDPCVSTIWFPWPSHKSKQYDCLSYGIHMCVQFKKSLDFPSYILTLLSKTLKDLAKFLNVTEIYHIWTGPLSLPFGSTAIINHLGLFIGYFM